MKSDTAGATWVSNTDTAVVWIQNPAGYRKWPPTDELIARMDNSFMVKCKGSAGTGEQRGSWSVSGGSANNAHWEKQQKITGIKQKGGNKGGRSHNGSSSLTWHSNSNSDDMWGQENGDASWGEDATWDDDYGGDGDGNGWVEEEEYYNY